ncbi:hypothetical protein Sjap_024978 [Stephania japonica]|uniref:Uncharacterized protein n=1 Tax=Stephania japonica TaxID=461633 RepID=A0AAP0HH32_9MAGN
MGNGPGDAYTSGDPDVPEYGLGLGRGWNGEISLNSFSVTVHGLRRRSTQISGTKFLLDTVSGVIGVGYDRATDPSFTGSVHCTPICYLCVGIHAFPFEQLTAILVPARYFGMGKLVITVLVYNTVLVNRMSSAVKWYFWSIGWRGNCCTGRPWKLGPPHLARARANGEEKRASSGGGERGWTKSKARSLRGTLLRQFSFFFLFFLPLLPFRFSPLCFQGFLLLSSLALCLYLKTALFSIFNFNFLTNEAIV